MSPQMRTELDIGINGTASSRDMTMEFGWIRKHGIVSPRKALPNTSQASCHKDLLAESSLMRFAGYSSSTIQTNEGWK